MIRNLLTCVIILISLGINAQMNPKNIYVNGKKSEPVTVDFNSIGGTAPTVVVIPEHEDTLGVDPLGGGVFRLTYWPEEDYLGDDKLTISYFEPSGIPGFSLPNYSTIHFRIEDSKLDAQKDEILVSAGGTTEIDVLINDNTTDGSLSLDRIAYVEGGTASISNNKISFTHDGVSNWAYVRYFTSDNAGNIEGATVDITIQGTQVVESRYLTTDDLTDVVLYLNDANYTPNTPPLHGTLIQDGHKWIYSPQNEYLGSVNIGFSTTDGGQVDYLIDIVDKDDYRSFVQDDRYFVVTDGVLDFNVFDNDYLDNFNIIDYSSDLTYLGNGQFNYTPPAGFTGDKVFYYKIFAGFQFHTGNILIHVDDYAPYEAYDYSFTILNNHDLVVTHEAPISNYSFNIVNGPAHGVVSILDATGTEVLDCETISGENTIVYSPDANYSGSDVFVIDYCTSTGICETVEVSVDILSSNYAECLCLSNCIYEGDANNDGVVDNKDILAIALNIGEGGDARSDDFDLFWTGQYADDWGYEMLNTDSDLKHTDTNGDSYIDSEDFQNVLDHYGSVHDFVPNTVGAISSVPVSFVPQSTDVDSGEWLFLDVYVGNVNNPALDFYGLAISLDIDPEVMDSASVTFVPANDNWLSGYTPLQEFLTVPVDGRIEMAVSRINNLPISGAGIIGTLGVIIEDETEGFKSSGLADYVARNIKMHDIVSVNANGEYRMHPEFSATINVAVEDLEEKSINLAEHVNVYPNPAQDRITIQSDKYTIDKLQLFDALGRQVLERDNATYYMQVDVSGLQEGIYFARVYAQGSFTTIKLQRFNR